MFSNQLVDISQGVFQFRLTITTNYNAMECSWKDMSLMYVVDQIEESLILESEVSQTRVAGVIDIPDCL